MNDHEVASSAGDNLSDLLAEINSPDSSRRWTIALSLSQFINIESALALHKLKSDPNELVRTAAATSLSGFSQSLLTEMETTLASKADSDFVSGVWKSSPLPPLLKDVAEMYAEAVLDIVKTEGPTTGGRLRRLLGEASLMGKGLNYSKLNSVLDPLLKAGLVLRVDRHGVEARLEQVIISAPGLPEIVVRPRNQRLLTEIPINEARAVLQSNTRYRLRPNKNLGFEVLSRHYEIQPNELFLVGEALENQWAGLFE